MSVHVSSWAWKQKLGDPGLKLVLVKLADNADDAGYSRWRQDRLADECEMSRATVQRKLKQLQEAGLLAVEPRANGHGFQVANGYRILRPSVPQSEAPSVHHNGDAAGASLGDAAGTVIRTKDLPPPSTAGRSPQEIDRKRVSTEEHDLCDLILVAFNDVFGTRFAGAQWRRSIIMRCREHPEVELAEHRLVIEHLRAHPWWKGEVSPNVVYGAKVFDRALNGVRSVENNGSDASEEDDAWYEEGAIRARG